MTSLASTKRWLTALAAIVAVALLPESPASGALVTAPGSVSLPSTPVTPAVHASVPTVSAPTVSLPPPPPPAPAPAVSVPAPPPVRLQPPAVSVPSVPAPATPRASVTVPATPVTPTVHASVPSPSAPATPSAQVGVSRAPSVSLSAAGTGVSAGRSGAAVSGSSAPAGRGSATAAAGSLPASGLVSFSPARSAAPAGVAAGVISTLFGPGPETGGAVSAPGGARAREAALAAEVALHELVRRLSGCLAQLPYEQRLALELRTGVGVANPLAPAGIASYLHVAERRLPALERSALIALVRTAHASGCGAGAVPADSLALLTSMQPLFGSAPGGSESGDLTAAPPSPDLHSARVAAASTAEDPLLGVNLPPEAQALLIALLAAGATLLVGLLFSDRFEVGTRLREWRFRRTHRPSA